MMVSSNLFLVGPMGAGKSTVGRLLSQALQRPFWDADKVVEERTGVNIPTIFDIEGEAGFRDRETRVLDELTRLDGIILATGGGVVLRETNRQMLQNRGYVIYLRVSPEQQYKRTRRDTSRPLLQVHNPRAKLKALTAEREPLYREVADLVWETGSTPAPQMLKRLKAHLRRTGVIRAPNATEKSR